MASRRRVRTSAGWSQRVEAKRKYRDGTVVRWSHNFPEDPTKTLKQNETDADARGIQAERDLDDGIHPGLRYEQKPAGGPLTVGEWVARWRQDRALGALAQDHERTVLDRYILPTWGPVPLDAEHVTRLEVQRWVNRLPGAPRSVHGRYSTFAKMIRDAIDEPGVPLNSDPCTRIALPKPEPTGRRALTEAEVAAIAAGSGHYGMVVWTLAFTGMRVSELLSRDISHLHPLSGLQLPPAVARRGSRQVESAAPKRRGNTAGKTPASIRTVSLCGSHRDALRAHLGARTEGPLFVTPGGSRPARQTVWKWIAKGCEAAGIDEPISPHWFRHTHKTWLREAKVDTVAIDERIGHERKGMDIYVHVTAAMHADILAELETRWAVAHGKTRPVKRRAGR